MIKVLHLFKTYRTETAGGIEEVMKQIGYGSKPYGIETSVLTLSKNTNPPIIKDGDIMVMRYPVDFSVASTGFSLKAMLAFPKIAKQADIIHYHFPWPVGDLMQFLLNPGKPYVVTYHSDIVKQKRLIHFYRPLMNWFLKNAEMIVATSPNYIASSKVLASFSQKTISIPIGIDEKPEDQPDAGIMEKMRKIAGHQKFFLFVGMLRYYKGLHYLLEANAGIDYPMVIAGVGPKEGELKELAAKLGLKNTIFVGLVSDKEKNALFKLCYGFVFPSHLRSEAFGISLLEAAMYSKPLISPEIGTGMSYINIDKKTGLCIPPADPQALRAAMKYIWDNEGEAEKMGKAARARYEELFTTDKMAREYVKLYERIVKK